jgi:hypothetical protein
MLYYALINNQWIIKFIFVQAVEAVVFAKTNENIFLYTSLLLGASTYVMITTNKGMK